MKKKNKKHVKRVQRLIAICTICAVILTVSTYAWFIGMKTVNVSSFDVKIAAIDSLQLSLNGDTWSDTVSISKDTYKTASYTGNTNSWGGTGLVPVSSVGVIDTTSSRLVMYEKGSFTASLGGYRLMASQVENGGAEEKDGYVAFDLFVKNTSGNEYYPTNNTLNEEAIYLTTDSQVKVADVGGVKNTGIENSVRVAFAQIGRVESGKASVSDITGITCDTTAKVTGICRTAQIWEPNDKVHVANAINWYATACKARTGASTYSTATGSCSALTDGAYKKTYAVSGVINYTDGVDAYDGTDYNGYAASVAATPTTGKLMAYDYFTDTKKVQTGTDRPTFITLAPNSVTKIRVYVYIEGQDIDNYDFASLGKKISVAFGFTKERFVDDDLPYDKTGVTDKDGVQEELPDDVKRAKHRLVTNGE